MERRWQLRRQSPDLARKIAESLQINPITAQVLLNRDIQSLTQAKSFLNPDQSFSSDSLDPDQLQKAIAVVSDTLASEGQFLIYGDYDVDGITSTTIMTAALRHLGGTVTYYIPSRFKDGYGLGATIQALVQERAPTTLITLDCGITNFHEIQMLKANFPELKIIICDHHRIPDALPPADAILNPRDLEETHDLYHLCSAGIAYKFMESFAKHTGTVLPLDDYLDLVALGTIADVAHLRAENRSLTSRGLKTLTSQKRPGIAKLLKLSDFQKSQVTTRDVGFTIAPKLNAAGRLADANVCVELLLSTDPKTVDVLGQKLQTLNQERQTIGQTMLQEAQEYLEQNPHLLQNKVLVLSASHWHPGVIGITASRLVSQHYLPTIMINYNEKIARGSARGVPGVDIYAVLKNCEDLFISFGGHKEAAGFSLLPEKIAELTDRLIEAGNTQIQPTDMVPVLDIDCPIEAGQLDLALAKELELLIPFGQGNPDPVFYSNALSPIEYRSVGNGAHLKVTFTDPSGKVVIDAIGFQMADKLPLLEKKSVEVVFHLQTNDWKGRILPQLQLLDLK